MKIFNYSLSSKYKSFNEFLNHLPSNEEKIIYIEEGIYNEKIIISVDNIKIIGKGKVIFIYNDYAKKVHEDGRDYNTFRTQTFQVLSNNVTLENITIENKSIAKVHGQAIALSVLGNHFKAINCNLISEQDTLFLGPLPDDLKIRYTKFLKNEETFINGNLYSIFLNCNIEGNIDFIFGTGTSLFNNCNFISNGSGYVFAPAHSLFQEYGFYALNCNFIKKDNNINDVYIGRLWRPYGNLNLIDCTFVDHINELGYQSWNNLHPEVFNRIYEYPLINNREKYIHTFKNDAYLKTLNLIKKIFNF